MSAESAKQEIKGSYGEVFVIMGTDRVEVSPDGKKLTTYTNESVETKSASGAATQGISISADFHTVVLNGATIERAADGHLVISSSGTVLITRSLWSAGQGQPQNGNTHLVYVDFRYILRNSSSQYVKAGNNIQNP